MNNNSIESKLASGKYKCDLSETLTRILNKVKSANTEATIASTFENELFYFIKSFFNIDIVFEKEVNSSVLRHKFNGRMDAVSNDLIIEYKKHSKLSSESDKDKATKQVLEYLEQLYNETTLHYQAILTDGQKLRFFYYQNDCVHFTPFRTLDVNDLDKLVRNLISVNTKKFVPENIIKDFKFNSHNSCTRRLASCLFRTISESITDKTDMLFQEWEVLFHLSENDRGQNLDIEKRRIALSEIFSTEIKDTEMDYKALFVLQTTYAIIVKMIACKVISKVTFDNDITYFSDLSQINSDKMRKFIEHLEDGYVFAAGGIRNLLEGDFFSWYSSNDQWSEELFTCIVEIVKLLENYTSTSILHGNTATDIFKDLYMEIMPNEVRHSLGEYFTPSWLADYVVSQSISMIEKKDWVAIDPCCGSGIFIISLINHIIGDIDISNLDDDEKSELLKKILARAQGIDINPLSVLTARVSYLLAVSPLLKNDEIEIPIYLGDSAYIPHKLCLNGIDCYRYTISTKQGNIDVTLPCAFVCSQHFLEKMSSLQTTIKADDYNLVYAKLQDDIGFGLLNDSVNDSILALSKRLVELHNNNWDGIWIRIVTNFMLIARLYNIDIIVGNPPWIKWEFLPQVYAEKIKSLCLDKRLFSGQTYMGAISLNICALISNITASSWLNEQGVLAFLMPKTLMTQDSYAGFRNFYTDVETKKRLFLQRVDDWSNSGNPFFYTQEKFLTYYYKNNQVDYLNDGVPITVITKKKGVEIQKINGCNMFSSVRNHFDFSAGKAYQLDTERTGFTLLNSERLDRVSLFSKIIGECKYKARSGVEFTPAEVYFIEPYNKSKKNGKWIFKNSAFKNSVYKAKESIGFELETKFVRPVVKSPCIKEFGMVESNNYCIFPYDSSSTDLIPLTQLNKDSELLSNYLISNKELICKQSKRSQMISRGNEFYALSKVGKYTFAEYAVSFRDNTKLVACVVTPLKTPWGEDMLPICAKHSPYISMDVDGNYITENEAHYLCGILNTSIVQEYFKSTFSGRSYSIAFNIKMPKYIESNEIQKAIVLLSKKAHENFNNQDEIDQIKLSIEELYLKLCQTN